jgi:hypothetical protein
MLAPSLRTLGIAITLDGDGRVATHLSELTANATPSSGLADAYGGEDCSHQVRVLGEALLGYEHRRPTRTAVCSFGSAKAMSLTQVRAVRALSFESDVEAAARPGSWSRRLTSTRPTTGTCSTPYPRVHRGRCVTPRSPDLHRYVGGLRTGRHTAPSTKPRLTMT